MNEWMFLYVVSYFRIWLKKIQYDHHKILVLLDVNLPFHLLTQVSTLGIIKLFKSGSQISLANYMQKCSLVLRHFLCNFFSIIWYQKILQTDSHKFWIQLYTSRYFYSSALGLVSLLVWRLFFLCGMHPTKQLTRTSMLVLLFISNSVLEPNGSPSQSLSQCP